jgi:hypothetical protein
MRGLLLFLLVACSCPAAESPTPWAQLVDPDAKTVIGLEWARIAESPYGRELKSGLAGYSGELRGLEFIEAVDRLVIGAKGSKQSGNPSVLVILQGRFDTGLLRQFALAHGAVSKKRAGEIEILSVSSSDGSMDLAIVDRTTMLAGDEASLVGAINRSYSQGTGRGVGPVVRRAAEIAVKSDLWVTGSPEIFSAGALEMAKLQLLRLGPQDPVAKAIMKSLETVGKGGVFEVALSLSDMPADLAKSWGVLAPQPAVIPKVKSSPAPPGERGKIRIYGLDDGTREVEVKP